MGRMGGDCLFSGLTAPGYRLLASLAVLARMDLYLLPEGSSGSWMFCSCLRQQVVKMVLISGRVVPVILPAVLTTH